MSHTKQDIERFARDLLDFTWSIYGENINLKNRHWIFKWNRTKRALGRCQQKVNTRTHEVIERSVQLSINILTLSIEDIYETILHEIAHAIDIETRGRSNHDNTWQSIAINIGCSGKAHSDISMIVPHKYEAVCYHCGNTQKFFSKPSRIYSCGACAPNEFNINFVMTVKKL